MKSIAIGLAALGFATRAQASDDPVFGPSPGLSACCETSSSAGSLYRDGVEELRARLIGRLPDARYGVPFGEATRTRSRMLRTTLLPRKPRLRAFLGIDLRRAEATEQLVGAPLPTDAIALMFPGVLVTSRLGIELGRFSLYGMGGAGGYRVLRLSEGVVPAGAWSGVLLGGLGAELGLGARIALGLEVTSMLLTARGGAGELLSPDPGRSIRLAAIAIRVRY